MFTLKYKRRILLMLIDTGILLASYAFSFVLTLISSDVEPSDILVYALNFAIFLVAIMLSRFLIRVYHNVWKYANSAAYLSMVLADGIGGAVALAITLLIGESAYIGGWKSIGTIAMFCLLSLVSRFVYQQNYRIQSALLSKKLENKITVAIVGAGRVGSLLAEELLCYKGSHYLPVCFIDTNEGKVGKRVVGLPVFAQDESVFEKMRTFPVQEIFIAIPQLDGEDARKLHEFFTKEGYRVKLYDFPRNHDNNPTGGRRILREFKIEDLLFRRAIKVTDDSTADFYRDRTVLVTGGGGSIGSELCRQIAECAPKKLIIFDIYENNAYDIQQQLTRKYGASLDLSVEIGSVRDRARLNAVFAHYRPEIVFHAAAHKHVPLMEHSNCEAIKNNVLGTYNTADMAEKYGVCKFILISTDKAVNPTNVMGASKRMCEMVIQCRTDGNTVFSAVRFGNVLGSNGSVIPLFNAQIASGGPVTITDKRIIRYFMTIPEASGLVMQAGAMAERGDLFVLDMGKPVKIYDLAENMIKLSGLRPNVDIEIKEIGLRPGEKLYEELLIKTEDLKKTENDLIFIEHDTPLTRAEVEEKIGILRAAVESEENEIASQKITEVMKSVVPTFHSPDEVNRTAAEAEEMRVVVNGNN